MLKLDLLPAHYTIARRNKKVIILSIPMTVGVALAWLLVMVSMNSTIAKTQTEYDETKTQADAVRKLQGETEARKAELRPIQDKVDFIQAADKSGGQYWERFHQINKYIYDRALVTNFAIAPPTAVSFNVELETTEDAGRFILNMIRCPYITGISISGQAAEGGQIQGAAGVSGGPAPMAAGPGGMPPGGPGMPPGGPEMGMPPGGAPGAGPAPSTGAAGPITFAVTATLVQPISIPAPPSAGGAGAPGMEGPGGPPGGPGGPPPGPGGPGGPPGAEPGGPGGGPPPPPSGPKGGGGDAD